MTEPLQSFDWKNSNYERPANDWVCGKMCELGLPCRLGPSAKGACQVVSQCEPQEKGGKYHCTRSAIHGGKCKAGPASDGSCCQADTSCQPRRSLPARRRLLGVSIAAAAICIGLFLFHGNTPSHLLSPGEVIASHATIEADCSACHSAAEGGINSWLHAAFDSQAANRDSALCLKCHADLGTNALFAHGLPQNELTDLTKQVQTGATSKPFALRLTALTGPPAENQKLTCATCHREHHGRKADLKLMTDLQCQTCHTQQFESFEHGHPALGNYPYQRRARINFDHNAHLNQYFVKGDFKRTMPDGRRAESCSECHTPDAAGQLMLTGSFEKNCASCHEPQIKDVEFPGIPFVSLPVIPQSMLGSEQVWPRTAGTFPSGRLPRLMELLLESDPGYQSALTELGTVDYRRLTEVEPDQYPAVAEIAAAITRMFYDISLHGEAAVKRRLGNSSPAYLQMKPSIVPSVTQAQQFWFPNSENQIRNQPEDGKVTSMNLRRVKKRNDFADSYVSNGWSLNHSDFSISYRPVGHADPLIRDWLDQAVQKSSENLSQDSLWQILSNPTGSGREDAWGAMASGRCLMCHSVDQNPQTGIAKVNWHAFSGQQASEPLTHFSHSPHLSMGQLQKCETCHTFESQQAGLKAIWKSEYFVRDPKTLSWEINRSTQESCSSGFRPVSRELCATCHNRQTATQSCLQCHSYHVHNARAMGQNGMK